MNSDYKVLALCLANHLQRVLPHIIHPSQTAFIKRRKIGDTINDTLDIMDWASYSRTPLLALTVDFRKAYDLVDRDFLLQSLSHLGLPSPFVHWVRLMHSGTSTCFAVNNLAGPLFPVHTGVRQGCPLAPLLFVCVIEIFHRSAPSPSNARYDDSGCPPLRNVVALPFGTHAFLSHPAILHPKVLSPSIPQRALAELRAFLSMSPTVLPPRMSPLCLLAEPTAFNRFILKPNGKPFGLIRREKFLLTQQVRLGDICNATINGLEPIPPEVFSVKFPPSRFQSGRRVLRELVAAIPPSWSSALRAPTSAAASPGDWLILSQELHSNPTLALQVSSFTPPHTLSVTFFRILPHSLIDRTPIGSGIVHIKNVAAMHTLDRWVAGPFHTGAGLGARLELLHDGFPDLASIRRLLYSQQQLDHELRWTRALTSSPPFFPNLTHYFLREQPSLQLDLLFRLYTRTLPSGVRFQFANDSGRCSLCASGELETIPHIFLTCGIAPAVISSLGSAARRHLGCSPPDELLLFPLREKVGQSAPWSLLVGAAAKGIWNARCERKFHESSSTKFEALQLILAQFLLAFKIFLWRSDGPLAPTRPESAASGAQTDGPVASPSLLRALHSTVESTQLSAPHASAPHPSGSAPHVSRSFSTAALSPLAAGLSTSAASSVPLPVQHGASTMRAAVMREVGAPLRVELLRIPRPQAGEVLIKTRACGVCHTDLHVMRGHVAFPAPCVLGHEVSGEVVDHGAGTDAATIARLPVGSRVVAAFIMPCGSCFFCTHGQEDICSTFFAFNRLHGTLYDGHTRLFSAHPSGDRMPAYLPGTLLLCMGGLADYCVAPASAVAPLPPALPLPEAAVMGCALFTAFGALRHAGDVRAGDTVAVVGAGGVGGSCVQVARAMGAASIVAVDVAEGKLQRCRALGATHTVNAAKEDVVEAIRVGAPCCCLTGGV
ncbi:unnamed protein product [Closterium sp. Yama58-4]|nr:unnamed protein product [Closterium sp. Yama58-4]